MKLEERRFPVRMINEVGRDMTSGWLLAASKRGEDVAVMLRLTREEQREFDYHFRGRD